MGMTTGGNRDTMSDINVTPLVDVMLVLLIIFMVTAPLLNAGVDIDLPKADAPPLVMDQEHQLILSIDEDLTYSIDESTFPREEIPQRLAAIANANPDQPVFLRADGDVPYKYVAELLAAAKNAGFPRLGMVMQHGVEEEDQE
ncbi:MAG: ExbD/TolR family protein [Deltaproteobacteria bacterium]|nr:ExbD/TolR family protein [Deltaproteobacteria bacterium]